jgi:hypothetical protein
MRPGLLALVAGVALAPACKRGDPLVYGAAPEVAFLQPLPGARLAADLPFTVRARVRDADHPEARERLRLEVQLDGAPAAPMADPLWEVDIVSFELPGLSLGDHHLRLTATDEDDQEGTDDVSLSAVANQAPGAVFVEPAGGRYLSERGVPVELRLTDADDPLDTLALSWSGVAASAPEAPASPPSSGLVRFTLIGLPAGVAAVGVEVLDPKGGRATAEAPAFEVVIGDVDGDGAIFTAWGGDDCDDTNEAVLPGATERCNGEDDDCDGQVDEGATDPRPWYPDSDGDGYGREPGSVACSPPAGHVAQAGDCDDTSAAVHPGAPERCNAEDDDCDGQVDEGAATTWYRDDDGDGWGRDANPSTACARPPGYVDAGGDCDDADPLVSPVAAERCNGEDDDCDGQLPLSERTDGDADGSPDCADCDDLDAATYPGASERCDLEDDDCDGLADEGACPCQVDHYLGRPYQFCTTPLTWDQAASACAVHGYQLASLSSSGEDAWVNQRINTFSYGYWWIGLRREGAGWTWSDGTPLGWSNWGPGEPNNLYGDEDCVELNRFRNDPSPHAGWNDQRCSSAWRYVCEAP